MQDSTLACMALYASRHRCWDPLWYSAARIACSSHDAPSYRSSPSREVRGYSQEVGTGAFINDEVFHLPGGCKYSLYIACPCLLD